MRQKLNGLTLKKRTHRYTHIPKKKKKKTRSIGLMQGGGGDVVGAR